YNQFAMTIVFSFVFSAINSLTFSPAMSGIFLRAKHGETKFFLFRWFNAGMRWIENSYDSFLEFTAHHWWTIVVPSVAILALTYGMLIERPKSFIPVEDQGYLIAAIQTPDGTGREETSRVATAVSKIALGLEGVADVVLLEGFNVLNSTNQTNSATAFVTLKEWGERSTPALRAPALTRKLQRAISKEVRGAVAVVLQPPPIRGLSQTGGFEFMIEDREGRGVGALAQVTERFLGQAREQPELGGLFTPFTVNVPQIRYELDRVKAQRLGVAVADVFSVLQAYLGGYYVNDFNLFGKVWKVMVQAEGSRRINKDDIEHLYVLNQKGQRVRLDSLGDANYALGPIDVPHYNMYNAAKITGQPAAGYSSGQAIAAMERLAEKWLPEGFSYEWTGTTFQEQKTGNLAMYIFALSIICVFLFMA